MSCGYALINFAFKATLFNTRVHARPFPPPLSSLHPSPHFFHLFPLLLSPSVPSEGPSRSLNLSHARARTHSHLDILSTVGHSQTQKSIASAGRGAKSVLVDRGRGGERSGADGATFKLDTNTRARTHARTLECANGHSDAHGSINAQKHSRAHLNCC